MSEVKRYEWGDDGMWEFNEQGRYVEASDHDHLISAKDALLAERDAEIGRLKLLVEWYSPVHTRIRLPGPHDGPFVITWAANGGAGIQDWSHVSPAFHTRWAHLIPPCICADPENCRERVNGCKRDLAALSTSPGSASNE